MDLQYFLYETTNVCVYVLLVYFSVIEAPREKEKRKKCDKNALPILATQTHNLQPAYKEI
jgi:hypothetical protein